MIYLKRPYHRWKVLWRRSLQGSSTRAALSLKKNTNLHLVSTLICLYSTYSIKSKALYFTFITGNLHSLHHRNNISGCMDISVFKKDVSPEAKHSNTTL